MSRWDELAKWGNGCPCVLTLGNRAHGDDAAGPSVFDRMHERFGGTVIDAGVAPENHLERVVATGADLVLVVDAADFGGSPGNVRLLSTDDLTGTGVSTHACSPRMLAQYITARSVEPPSIRWLVVQPATGDGETMSPAVADASARLADQLCSRWPAHTQR